jgi:two-component system chemotaxis response regulator CheY
MNKTYKTLIVDDSLAMRLVLNQCLQDSEFEVVEQAESGEDAIEKFKQFQPEVVLLDIVMPGISGVEALEEIVKIDPNVIALMASSLGTEKMIYEALKMGAKNFIQKPFEKEEVLKALRTTVESIEGS